MTIKELFDGAESLTLEQAEKIVEEKGAKFVDLAEGGYVSKDKYDNEVANKDKQISQLNESLKARDKDLKDIKTQLQDSSVDSTAKLEQLEKQLGELQSQYKTDTENYKKQLSEQAYDFAVKEFAGTKQFSSKAARRDFERELKAAQLKMDGSSILGAEDYATKYFGENPDALVVAEAQPAPATPKKSEPQTATFVAPTTPAQQTTHKSLSELMRMKNENPDAVINMD